MDLMEDNLNDKLNELKIEFERAEINPICDDPDYLVKFLRARSLDVAQTVNLMRTYLNYKAANPKMFNLPFRMKPVFEDNVMQIHNTRSLSGEALIVFKPGNWDPSEYSFDSLLSACLLSMEAAALDVETQKAGIIMIADMDSFGWKQVRHFSPFQAKKLAHLMEKIVPVRINGINIFNQSRMAEMAWTVIKPFLGDHLKSRTIFHGADYSYLQDSVKDYDCLPHSLGGRGGPIDCSDFYRSLANDEELFKSFGYM